MNTAIEILGYGGVIPAAVALSIAYLAGRFLPAEVGPRYALPLALGVAFFVGYVLLPDWAALQPNRHWHWLPYLGAAAMLLGPLGLATGVWQFERWLLFLLLALVTAWLLVPTWATLKPPRPVYIAILVAYLILLAALLDALPSRLLGRLFPVLLGLASAAAAVLAAVSVSLLYGQVAGVSTAALAGAAAAGFISVEKPPRGLILPFVVLVGGVAFVASIGLPTPQYELLLIPAAPLALWAFAVGPLSRLTGVQAVAAQVVAVLAPLVVVGVWVAVKALQH